MAAPNNWHQNFPPNSGNFNVQWQQPAGNAGFTPETNTGQQNYTPNMLVPPQFPPGAMQRPPPPIPRFAPPNLQFSNPPPNATNFRMGGPQNFVNPVPGSPFIQQHNVPYQQQGGMYGRGNHIPSFNNENFDQRFGQSGNFAQNTVPHQGQSLGMRADDPTAQNTDILKRDQHMVKEDQQWMNNWLSRRTNACKEQGTAGAKHLKIWEAQEKTQHMLVLLAKLKKNKEILETMANEDSIVWEQKLNEVERTKNELEAIQKEVTNEDTLRDLQKKISKRRKKRERVKRKRREEYEKRLAELAQREQKHAEIDKAMQQIVEKQKEAKQEADMQKEGDQILSQVRRKIMEANRAEQLLTNVQKLRKVRRDRLERQGVLGMCEPAGSASTLMFDARMDSLHSMLQDQLKIYRAEEAALKVILETEQEESREKEREKAKKQMEVAQKIQQKKEEKMLFGNQKEPQMDDPLFPFWQFYHQAEASLEALVAVRREWDMYLVLPATPGSSTIPEGYVIPTPPSSDKWSSALDNS